VTALPVSRRFFLTGLGLFVTGIIAFPIYWLIVTSLRAPADLQNTPSLLPVHIDASAYLALLHQPDLLHYLVNSAFYGICTTVLTVALGASAAYALARLELRGKTITLFGLLVLQTFPSIMLAIPLFVMFSRLHLIDSRMSVVVAITTKTLPFAILMLRPYFMTLPKDLENAAAVDGCGRISTLVRVILPLSLPGIATVAAFNFLSGWGDLLFSLTLLTDESKKPISLGLYKFMGVYGTDWNQLMAASVAAALPALLVFAASQRFLISGLAAGSSNE
jgi:multiple sugar transport system permease protein